MSPVSTGALRLVIGTEQPPAVPCLHAHPDAATMTGTKGRSHRVYPLGLPRRRDALGSGTPPGPAAGPVPAVQAARSGTAPEAPAATGMARGLLGYRAGARVPPVPRAPLRPAGAGGQRPVSPAHPPS